VLPFIENPALCGVFLFLFIVRTPSSSAYSYKHESVGAMIVDDRYILVRLGRFCLWVNGTAILVSINQPLRICVNAILSHERLCQRLGVNSSIF
jgi:hypothetical protein